MQIDPAARRAARIRRLRTGDLIEQRAATIMAGDPQVSLSRALMRAHRELAAEQAEQWSASDGGATQQ